LPNSETGTPYSQTLAATGDTPITWSVESGALPTGLTLSGNTISGTPTAAGAFNFTVKATNAAGNGTKPLSITITTPPPAGGFTTIAAFKTWLDAQPANTAAAPYSVKVNIADLGGQYDTAGSLGNALFTNRSPAKYINLDLSGSTFTAIGDGAFQACTNLTGVTIPNSVTTIGDSAFSHCWRLTSITIPDSVTSIGYVAFYRCDSLISVTFQGTIASNQFDDEAFSRADCTKTIELVSYQRAILHIIKNYFIIRV
jgi:hypothetical protein